MKTVASQKIENGSEAATKTIPAIGAMRSRDFVRRGVSRQQVKRMLERGDLERLERGLYRLPDAEWTQHHLLAEVALRAPRGIVCLTSALAFHGLTTQIPSHIHLMIATSARPPQFVSPPLRIFHASGEGLTAGVEEHDIEGVAVRITGMARTVADCFKYRNKIGLDIALEALKECLRRNPETGSPYCSREELWKYALILRVSNVMRPYLEALSS